MTTIILLSIFIFSSFGIIYILMGKQKQLKSEALETFVRHLQMNMNRIQLLRDIATSHLNSVNKDTLVQDSFYKLNGLLERWAREIYKYQNGEFELADLEKRVTKINIQVQRESEFLTENLQALVISLRASTGAASLDSENALNTVRKLAVN